MAKQSRSEEEEEHYAQESGEGSFPPPTKKTKKSAEKKTEKKTTKSKNTSKGSSPSTSASKKGNVAKNVFENAQGEKFIDLGKKRRATVRSFKGSVYVDIREFYGDGDDLNPGKKGISLSVEQWEELKANTSAIDSLIQKLKT